MYGICLCAVSDADAWNGKDAVCIDQQGKARTERERCAALSVKFADLFVHAAREDDVTLSDRPQKNRSFYCIKSYPNFCI